MPKIHLLPPSLPPLISASPTHPAWDAYVQSHPQGGAYLTTGWKQAVERGYGHQGLYLGAFRDDVLAGGLPLVLIKPPLPLSRAKLVSLPFCDYGGLLADNPETAAALLERAVGLARERRAGLEIRCAAPSPFIEAHGGFGQITDKCRMLLELPGSADALWAGFKSKLRSQVNRAGKDGLTARLGGEELLADFYRVFSRNMRDLGSPVHGLAWLRAVIAAYGDQARIGVVHAGDQPAAAGIILAHARTVVIPWASALREYNRLSPNMLLYWTFLRYAADQGFAQFDFGRSTPGEGTYKFKQQWGARPAPLAWYRLGAATGGQDPEQSGTLRSAVETVWRRLPLSVATALGPWLRRYVDR
ncbi:FemAB family XrtA/PEP-CTERM system-associated protein [Desulfonatronum thioautotrophicum]|uniref:FemAB family XrtA/PEP-CTERM system-associated protein n=1 Tax=Desulfonatronum thioautotrophicum TaxID=617001 RepID=UPI0005EB24FD|nr:FemAB family XrtA/PEP-CTERM system-associated protein [Desulfonatronum thioautotrophicum]